MWKSQDIWKCSVPDVTKCICVAQSISFTREASLSQQLGRERCFSADCMTWECLEESGWSIHYPPSRRGRRIWVSSAEQHPFSRGEDLSLAFASKLVIWSISQWGFSSSRFFHECSSAQVWPETTLMPKSAFIWFSSGTSQLHSGICCFPQLLSPLVEHSRTHRNADSPAMSLFC